MPIGLMIIVLVVAGFCAWLLNQVTVIEQPYKRWAQIGILIAVILIELKLSGILDFITGLTI